MGGGTTASNLDQVTTAMFMVAATRSSMLHLSFYLLT